MREDNYGRDVGFNLLDPEDEREDGAEEMDEFDDYLREYEGRDEPKKSLHYSFDSERGGTAGGQRGNHGQPQGIIIAVAAVLVVVLFVMAMKMLSSRGGSEPAVVPASGTAQTPVWDSYVPERDEASNDPQPGTAPVSVSDGTVPVYAPNPTPAQPTSVWLADLEYFVCEMDDDGGPCVFYVSGYWDNTDNTGKSHEHTLNIRCARNGSQTYLLDGKYDGLSGVFYLRQEERDTQAKASLSIFGDGRPLWSCYDMTGGIRPVEFNIDVSGVDELKLVISCDWSTGYCFALGDVLLYTSS